MSEAPKHGTDDPHHVTHSVLSRETIKDRIRRPISDPKSLVITPLLPKADVYDHDSIDLRLGSYFLIPQSPPAPFLDPTEEDSSRLSHLKVHKPIGSYLVIPAHQTVLGATLEFIKLPHDVSGQILTKSSVARTFLLIETAPWVHPLYRGCLTLEIANVSNTPQLLYPGFYIGQLILIANDRAADESQPLSGAYVGPIEPESPALKHPAEVLKEIGISRYRDPHSVEWRSTTGVDPSDHDS
jgi:dCTP deaminase